MQTTTWGRRRKEKFQNNLRAIEVLHIIEREKRPATYDEQKILSKYVGWGGLADAFDSARRTGKQNMKR